MFLTRLVYTSTLSQGMGPEDLQSILETAKENNKRNDVTGLLCFHRKFFLQCLEGSRSEVNKVYHKILRDPRHTNIIMLDYKEIWSREFSEWSMGYIPESSLTAPLNLKYSGNSVFSPYEMSGESAHRLMLALRDTVPLI